MSEYAETQSANDADLKKIATLLSRWGDFLSEMEEKK
jgi:hypothetical protein